MDLQAYRREFTHGGLDLEDLAESPFDQFEVWLKQAITAGVQDPTAMSLATVDQAGRPWQRFVLLKHSDDQGFVFFTNLESQKSEHIGANPEVCLQFPWLQLDRQVMIGGRASKLPVVEALRYFATRPRESQLAAWASRQSSRLHSRQALEGKFLEMKARFAAGKVPLPSFWGGYRVVPHTFEFWQGRENRMHDRFLFRAGDSPDAWTVSRLSP